MVDKTNRSGEGTKELTSADKMESQHVRFSARDMNGNKVITERGA